MASLSPSSTRLGRSGPEVSRFALGCAAMSGTYGQARDDAESLATIDAALDAGISLIDTADFYGTGHNELLIGQVLRPRRSEVTLSVKFGALVAPGRGLVGIDTRPDLVRDRVAHSLTRLGVDHIDVVRPARLDPNVPIEETVGALSDLVAEGWIGHIGLSEVGAETIRRAHAVHPICDVQIEYSLLSRTPEERIFPVLEDLGIGLTAYGVLSHGLLTDRMLREQATDARAGLPRFQGDNLTANRQLVAALADVASSRGLTTAQLATAWVAAQGAQIVPVIGARTRTQLRDSLGAMDVVLSPDDLAAIERAIPREAAAGARYPERFRALLDE